MKMMMIITGMQSGGAERVMATLCNELSKRHQVRLVIMKDGVSDYRISERVEVAAGKVSNQSLIQSVAFVRKQIDEWKPDVALSFMTKSNIVALMANLLTGKKARLVIAERANPHYAKRVFKILRRILYPMAHGCVFQTRQAQDYYRGILKCESVVLRNPLNPDFKVDRFTGERKKTIITMGRLYPEKNQKLLIDAFAEIAGKYPEYSVEIYGDGPLKEELTAHIAALQLQERVHLMGRKDHIQQHIADAGVFVLPSDSEGMPNALIEAMALGIPSIATDCPIGGPAVIIEDHENGILVPVNDRPALTAALQELIDNAAMAERLGRSAGNVMKEFSEEAVCAQWEDYLSRIAHWA